MNINRKLPQIIIPRDKLIMFMDWWDNDIRFEHSVPKAFNEGYLLFKLPETDFTSDMSREAIKLLAKYGKYTYREVENRLKQLNDIELVEYLKYDKSMRTMEYDPNSDNPHIKHVEALDKLLESYSRTKELLKEQTEINRKLTTVLLHDNVPKDMIKRRIRHLKTSDDADAKIKIDALEGILEHC